MMQNPQDPVVKGSLYDKLGAIAIAVFLAAMSFFATMLTVGAFSATGYAHQRFGDEGSAWLGISVGLPLALIVATVAFLLTLRWRWKRT